MQAIANALCVKQMNSTWLKFDKNEDSVHALLYTDKNAQDYVRQVKSLYGGGLVLWCSDRGITLLV